MILGDKPIIIKPVEDRSSIASLFGQGGTIGGMSCEFGVEQVILVRDQVCKGRIFEQIGRRGLVLTIIECKGLEFQDVLLYNFFTDSNLSQKWRVLYNYVQEKNISCGRKQSFPRFDSRIHNCLCSEFKQLYVAITRSKQRLWIYDEDFELQKPMLDYWNALDLVQTMELNESLVSSFQSISTCTQWKDRGTQLFNDRQYDMAMLCFERAGDMYRKRWCEAAFCQQIGERKLGVDPKDAVSHLNKAVEIYKSLGKFEMAAKCLIKMKDFKQAGVIYQDLLNPPKLEEAGDCFAEAKCWNEAADAYGRACSIQKCLSICGHVRLWEKGRMFIELWQDQWSRSEAMYEKELRGKIDESTENMKIDFLKRAAQYYHRMKDMHSMMKFVNMFPKTSLKRIFLSRRDHHQELMQVEIIAKNYREASKVAEQMGNLELAAEMLEKDGSYVEGASKLVKYVRLEMLWGNDNKGWPLRPCDGLHLLTKAKGLAKGDLKLLNEIRVLETSDAIIVQLLENYKVTRELNDGLVEIIVLHQLLDESIRSYTSDHSAILGPLLVDKCLDLQTFGPIDSLQLVILIWNQWYSKVSSLIKALVKLQKKPNVSGDEMLLDPCFGYLGVTPISGAEGMGFVNVDNSAAYWLQKDELHSLSNQAKRAKVSIKRVSILGKEFWASQMVATGIECARLLEGCVDGNASVNDQCQLILKVIEIYTKLLDLEVMKKIDTDFSQDKILSYRLKLYDRIFLKACGTFEMCELREDGRVTVHLEKLLEGFLGTEGPGTYEELGCLEILLPFLSRVSLEMVKNKTIKMVCGGQASDLQSLIKFYLQNWINFYADCHEVSCCSCYFFGSIRNPGNALNDIFSMYSVKLKGYITPAAFIYLFEKAFVVTYACLSHCEDLIISSKIIIDHMTGKRQEIMYSMMLKMSCDGGHQAWVKGLSALVGMGTYLLTRGNELLEWLKYSNVMEQLPNVVFRLIRILATMYMDTRNVNEHMKISQGLAHIFIERSPILEGLPDEFRRKIQIAFDKSMTDSRLRSMFAEAMKLVGDPFVILRKRGKPRIRNTRMQIVHVEIESGKFSLSRLKTQQLQDSKEKDRKLENETNEDEKVDTNEDHKEDTDEDQKEDNYQVVDLSTESSATVTEESLKPSMQPWYIFVDDRKLAWFIGWRLQRKLRLARDRLQEDDSVRIARLTFSRMGCNNSQYVDTFVAQVCPLKVAFEEFLTEMNAQIQVMKATGDDLLDEMAEFQEESGSVLELLSSSHPGHRQFDVAWLESQVIRPGKRKLEKGKKTFGSVREFQPIQEQKSKGAAAAAHNKSQNKRAKKKNRK